ncbi:MAG: hypothetical protein PHD20_05985, partial [Clostridia bacterium]|nr:hypothetical protein [Clostridia bacterium]
AVIVIAGYLLVAIWSGNYKETVKTETDTSYLENDLGKYRKVSITSEEQLSNYSNKILSYLKNGDIDKLYDIINPEYKEYFKLTKEDFKNKLKEKGFLSNSITISKYNLATYRDHKIIRYNISSSSNVDIQDYINVCEYGPNNIGISLDKFISYNNEKKEYIREGLSIIIYDKVIYDNKIEFKITIKNNSDENIILNPYKEYETFFLNVSTVSTGIRPTVPLTPGKEKKINKNQELNLNLEFNIPDLNINMIKELKIKDIKLEKTGVIKDILLEL